MALTLGDNFSYLGAKPLDGRVKYDTIAQMAAMSASTLYDGIIAYCVADGKNYQWKSTNDVDATLGKWRELASGGGGQTYNDFTGATSSTAGAHGLVPAPSAGDEGKVLFGNGLWGALPSVDLSVLSNEAFIFSATEKPVGMWTNRKLIYSKTVYVGKLPNKTTTHTPHGISDIDEIVQCYGIKQYGHTGEPIPNNEPNDNSWAINLYISNTEIQIKSGQNQSIAVGYVVIFYTKTTDSPLPSDVKFAGVTASGEVILEKTVTGLNLFLVWDQQYVAAADMPYDTSSIGKLISLSGVGHSGENTPMSFALTGYVTGNNIKLICPAGAYVEEVTVRYTTTS